MQRITPQPRAIASTLCPAPKAQAYSLRDMRARGVRTPHASAGRIQPPAWRLLLLACGPNGGNRARWPVRGVSNHGHLDHLERWGWARSSRWGVSKRDSAHHLDSKRRIGLSRVAPVCWPRAFQNGKKGGPQTCEKKRGMDDGDAQAALTFRRSRIARLETPLRRLSSTSRVIHPEILYRVSPQAGAYGHLARSSAHQSHVRPLDAPAQLAGLSVGCNRRRHRHRHSRHHRRRHRIRRRRPNGPRVAWLR